MVHAFRGRCAAPVFFAILLLLLLCTGCGGGGGSDTADRRFALDSLERADVRVNGQAIRVWIMDTPEKRAEGMMFLTNGDVGETDGMLFVYPDARPLQFWMRNTGIPLDIAFIGGDKVILNTAAMQPFDETGTNSAANAQYALEVRQGTLARFGIVPGMTVEFPDTIRAAR